MGPCADKQLTCIIQTKDGRHVIGRNDCRNPQPVCPRLAGEGYEKCRTICGQDGHAEIMAIREARRVGLDLKGARAYLIGIDWICQHCRAEAAAAGIERIYIRNYP